MNKYLGTKIVSAKPMNHDVFLNYIGRSGTTSAAEGYLVEYEPDPSNLPNHPDHAGYISWSPKEVFEKAYRPVTGLDFGAALEALKAGKRVARKGWNGKGMYLWLLPAAMVKAEWCRESHLKEMAEANGGEIEALGSIRMMTADKKVLTGWLASQTDMLSEDWEII